MPEVRWRVDHRGVTDVLVRFPPDSTVGEVAGELAATLDGNPSGAPLTLSVGTEVVPVGALAAASLPRSGSTVRLVEVRNPDTAATARPASPVVLSGSIPGRPTGRRSTRLAWGYNRLGTGMSIEVAERILVRDHGAGVAVNGIRVRGNAPVSHGDLLRAGDSTATVSVEGILRPPPRGGPSVEVPVARGAWVDHEPAPVDLPTPPGPHRHPTFPWLTALVPLLMGAGVWLLTRSLLMVGFMAFSFVYVLASGIEARVESRAARRFAVDVFSRQLGDSDDELERRRRDQEDRDECRSPSASEVLGWVDPTSHRLWERSGSHPQPLAVRLGTARQEPDDPCVAGSPAPAEFRAALARVVEAHESTTRPLVVDLAATGGLAVVGDDDSTIGLRLALAAQLALLVPPDRVRIEVDSPDTRWRWVHWLPHSGATAPTTLRITERGEGTAPSDGEHPIWWAPDAVGLPESVRAVVHVDNSGHASFQVDHGAPIEFCAGEIDHHDAERAARALCGLAPRRDGAGGLEESVDPVALGMEASPAAIAERWRERRAGLEAIVGLVAGGGSLSLDLENDGPHALVAGTTGAGKSELLRTLLVGLATRQSPSRVNFLLVDYKGGAAFGPLASLPHCVGLVTDLDETGVQRTLVSLRAEIRRREQVLDAAGASDASELPFDERPPSLVLVVDEFAALVAEVPDFLDGVLDVAQRGRSLGVHLVLATQRPAGVISDAVRANTSIRIALRLPDPEDSSDVIDSTAASRIPRSAAGRALVRLSHDSLVEVQVAHTGASVRRGSGVSVRLLGEPPRPPRRPVGTTDRDAPAPPETQLEALVTAIRAAAEVLDVPEPVRPVPEPLPEKLDFDAVPGAETPGFAIGLVDRPDLQHTRPLTVDPMHSGGVLVIGGSRSGASTTLATIGAAMLDRGWEVRSIDATGTLASALGPAGVQPGVDGWDHELVRRLLEDLLGRVQRSAGAPTPERAAGPGSAGTVLLLDGFGAFEEVQSSVNRGWAVDTLTSLALRGRATRVVLVMSARRRSEVPPALLNALSDRIALRCSDADEASLLDAPEGLADTELPPGRCWVRGHWAQIAQADRPFAGRPAAAESRILRRLPERIDLTDLEQLCDGNPGPTPVGGSGRPDRSDWWLPIGIESSDFAVAALALDDTHALIAGTPRSGVSTAIDTVASAATRRGIRTVVLDAEGRFEDLASLLEDGPGTGADTGGAHPTVSTLVLVDQIERWAELPRCEEVLLRCLDRSHADGIRLVAGGDATGILRCYSPLLARLRAMRTGLLLGPSPETRGDILHYDLPSRDDLPDAAGRGWLTCRAGASPVQVAHP